MRIIDTHCHINADQIYPIRDEVISRAKENGVEYLFNNGDSLPSLERILSLSKEYSCCKAVLGIHPEFAKENDEYFNAAYQIIRENRNAIYAIGEIGLDYHYDKSEETKELQKKRFIEQIHLAKELTLPIVIHTRDADFDTLDIIKKELPPKIDLHCYSGSYEVLEEYLKLPIEVHIGIGGVSTFKNAKTLVNIIIKEDENIFLSETDCPYLAPVPHRGEMNEPSFLPLIIEKIASLKGIDKEEMAEILYRNGKRFYGID